MLYFTRRSFATSRSRSPSLTKTSDDDEMVRRSKDSANRVLTMVKAFLNDAWQDKKKPMKMMAESYGTHPSLGEILPKLRCRQCGQALETIELTDDPTRDAPGKVRNTDAWAIDLSRYAGPRDAARICKRVGR